MGYPILQVTAHLVGGYFSCFSCESKWFVFCVFCLSQYAVVAVDVGVLGVSYGRYFLEVAIPIAKLWQVLSRSKALPKLKTFCTHVTEVLESENSRLMRRLSSSNPVAKLSSYRYSLTRSQRVAKTKTFCTHVTEVLECGNYPIMGGAFSK